MNSLDYILLAPILFGIAHGLYRGFFRELVVIGCIVVAIFVSRYFGEFIAQFLAKTLDWNQSITKPISFAVIFVGALLGLKILAGLFTQISKAMTLSWLNRLLGGLLGGFKWLLITSVVVNLLSFFHTTTKQDSDNRLAQSQFYQPIKATIENIIPLLNFEHFTNKIDSIVSKPPNAEDITQK